MNTFFSPECVYFSYIVQVLLIYYILQSCSPGYKREGNMLVGGRCVPCECNNHADVCDPYTGICQVCYFNMCQIFFNNKQLFWLATVYSFMCIYIELQTQHNGRTLPAVCPGLLW